MSNSLTEHDRVQAVAFVDQAVGMGVLPTFVFNSAVTAATASEVLAVLQFGSKPIAVMSMSPVVAKTLAASLTSRIAEYEKKTGMVVPTIDQIASR
ncbi:hypothetical protein ACELLULO517_07570 [Acidisoma cellulosilytica]|uniref:DUF3467 domain-containing protein n=1 Tax=Acidisoma cellulosilyticum TaxID=2802395 RepID=A0A963Z053_9PROT|nr:hypothetical protein [Acidisoma cellulosilyticum]MCB8880089.1 hypothetical protein [Acidisoma cellulosilyticum]